MKKQVAVLISGGGSNLQALIDACAADNFPAQIALVISNKADAYGLVRAKNAGIDTYIVKNKDYANRAEFDAQLAKIIDDNNIDIICLAGFMRLLTADFTQKYTGRMINIHPSLLPAFKGANAQRDALEYGVKIAGCTTHYVTEEMDSGEIIMQASVPVLEGDNVETLKARILEQEHIIYPKTLEIIATC